MIEIRGLKQFYADRCVLDIPELTIARGESLALIGPNGCGKTTLLRLLAGTLKPDMGTISTGALIRGAIGYLPQKPYAFDLSVLRNVELSLSGERNRERLALDALERVGLASLRHAKGNRLSGGEMQRMALARVLAKPRELLLLDEPTSSADILAIDQIERALEAYQAETSCTLVFSSHAPSQAQRLSRRVLTLDAGRIGELGETDNVLHVPQAESTRAFLEHWKI